MSKLIELPLYPDAAPQHIERRQSELAAHCSKAVREFRRQKQIDMLNEAYESGYAAGRVSSFFWSNLASLIIGAGIVMGLYVFLHLLGM